MTDEKIIFDLNSRIALWLESVRLYLNHTETEIKRKHGEACNHWRKWVEMKGQLFDTHVAYRFMYQLRNYLHVKMPATKIRLTSWEVKPGVSESALEVMFDRDELLSGMERKQSLKPTFEQCQKSFP